MKAEVIIQMDEQDKVSCLVNGARQDVIAALVISLMDNKTFRDAVLNSINRSLSLTREVLNEQPGK